MAFSVIALLGTSGCAMNLPQVVVRIRGVDNCPENPSATVVPLVGGNDAGTTTLYRVWCPTTEASALVLCRNGSDDCSATPGTLR